MGRTLNLCECLLTMGRDFQALGRPIDAARVLQRLTGFRDLPATVAEEAHARLAELRLEQGEYAQARRHLTSVLFYRPSHAPSRPTRSRSTALVDGLRVPAVANWEAAEGYRCITASGVVGAG